MNRLNPDFTRRSTTETCRLGRNFVAAGFVALACLCAAVVATGYHAVLQPRGEQFYAGQNMRAAALVREAEVLDLSEDEARMQARFLAEEALRVDPLDVRSLKLLARIANLEGRDDETRALLEAAAARSARDAEIQVLLIEILIAESAFADALARIDALMRARPQLRDPLGEIMIMLAPDPGFREALVAILAREPPWRGQWLVRLAREGDIAIVSVVLDALRRTPAPPAAAETGALVDRHISEGQIARAYGTWLASLPPERLAQVRDINNGGFEAAPDGLAFDWRLGRLRNVEIRRSERTDTTGGHALRVDFGGGRARFSHVSQVLFLPPGSFRLTGQARMQNLRTARGLRWRVACATGDRRRLGESPALRGTTPWQQFHFDFTVEEGCDGQILRLELDARAALDTEISGQALFDDLVIERLEMR